MQKGIWKQESWETWASSSVLHQLPEKSQWAAWVCHLLKSSTWGNNGIQCLPSLQPFPSASSSGPTQLHVGRCHHDHLYLGWHPEYSKSPNLPVNVNHGHTTFLSPQTTVPGFWHQSSEHPHPLKSWIRNICSPAPGKSSKVRFVYAACWRGGRNCDCFVVYTDLHHHHVP